MVRSRRGLHRPGLRAASAASASVRAAAGSFGISAVLPAVGPLCRCRGRLDPEPRAGHVVRVAAPCSSGRRARVVLGARCRRRHRVHPPAACRADGRAPPATFIRVYGDVDLFRRFKWTFVLAPAIPLGFATAVLVYFNSHDYPVEYVLYLFILLALWDPWHFLMQHYGFTRIYDRHNAAPKKLAARMDLFLSAAWFISSCSRAANGLPASSRTFRDGGRPRIRAPFRRRGPRSHDRDVRRRDARDRRLRLLLGLVPAPRLLREHREARAVRDYVRRDVHRLYAEFVDPFLGAGWTFKSASRFSVSST